MKSAGLFILPLSLARTLDEIRISNRSTLLANRAEAYSQSGDLDRATADIERAIELE